MSLNLPIEVVGTNPPVFRWRQVVHTPIGPKVVDHSGPVPPTIEEALVALIGITRQQQQEIIGLRKQLEQAETTSKKVQVVSPPNFPLRKSRS